MANFTFIHGAWHGPWCWYKIENLPKSSNHKVNLIDLNEVKNPTTRKYARYVDDIICKLPDEQIIIGHSMAGLILSQLTCVKIKKIIYLSAFMLKWGEKITDIIDKFRAPYLKLEFDKRYKFCQVIDKYQSKLFYNKCSIDDINFAKANLKPQTYDIFNQNSNPKSQNFKRYYIRCIFDNIVTIEAQNYMIASQKLDDIYTLESDHSPFFSDVENFYNLLIKIEKHK